MIYTVKDVRIEYEGQPLPGPGATVEIDCPEGLEAGVKQWITEITVPVIGSATPEGEALLDRMYWDAWEHHVMTAIDAGEVIPACARILELLRLCIGVLLSGYGVEAVRRVVDAFYVKYGLSAAGHT